MDTARLFELAIESFPAGILIVEPEGTLVLVNREVGRQFGYPRPELIGQGVERLLPEAMSFMHAAQTKSLAHGPESHATISRHELLGLRKDGSSIPVEIGWNPIETPDGFFFIASVVDISERSRSRAPDAQRSRDQSPAETVGCRPDAQDRSKLTRVVGESPAVRRVLEQIEQVSITDSTVLLLGETGTGKELLAARIHELGARRARLMVRVNCAAIPATLVESELFGREKGAFTGALSRQIGRFELANHSTIFLDEIGDLPADVQVKLLRVLEERQIERLGSPQSIAVDTRIIAATHRNLEQRISEGLFREDLFYRLNVFPIYVPPLRERVEDIPQLVWRFVEEFATSFGKRIESIDRDNLIALQQYTWPGNIRELRNAVERAMIVATGRQLVIPVPQATVASTKRSPKLIDVEKEHILGVLEHTGWRIRGATGAAARLGLKPTTLETRMAKLGLKRTTHH
jgi:formate hydrogenlyase transcriptional activator